MVVSPNIRPINARRRGPEKGEGSSQTHGLADQAGAAPSLVSTETTALLLSVQAYRFGLARMSPFAIQSKVCRDLAVWETEIGFPRLNMVSQPCRVNVATPCRL